jgi:tRNA(Ile)-lysidine synthase
MLLRTVRGTIEKYGMFKAGDTVVVALSGGPDSVAMLHVLNSLKGIYRIKLHAAHLEHGLRGEESLEDMRFVEQICQAVSIPLTTQRAKVPDAASSGGLSVEAVARKIRYAFLERVLGEVGGNKIATGHNADDQAETVLLNILRGAAMAGLSGVRPAVESRIVRPLIEATRDEIIAYLDEKKIDYRIDSSNTDERYERNKVRSTLIPLIKEQFNPRIVESLARTASVFSMIDAHFRAEVAAARELCCRTEDGRSIVDLEAFKDLPRVIKLFTFYSILRSVEGDEQVVSFDSLNAILNLAVRSKSGSQIDIGSGIVALKEYDKLVLGRDIALVDRYEIRLKVPGETRVEQAAYTIRAEVLKERPGTGEIYRSGRTAFFDFGAVDLPLIARSWREGDRFVPFGLSGTKKVHDVFIDEKVPVSKRTTIPIICDSEGILWVAGVRRAERARITEKTETILKITYEEDD